MEKVSAVVEGVNNPKGLYDINQEYEVHVD